MTLPTRLADLTTTQAARLAAEGAVLAVPLGSTEQHGPHLPLSTDTDVAIHLAERLSIQRSDVVVAPALAYGASGEHAGFAGTISIGQQALELLLIEYGRSATETFARVLFVNGHGGNVAAARRAVDRLVYEGRDVRLHNVAWTGDVHAGRTETALQLALNASRVLLGDVVCGQTLPLAEILPVLQTLGVKAVSPNGILGDPRGASAAEGEALLRLLGTNLAAAVEEWVGTTVGTQ